MKHSFCISFWLMTAWLLPCTLVSAQTPFDAFSPETSRIILDGDSIAAWRADRSKLDMFLIVFDAPENILYFRQHWLSVDPLIDQYIGTSPYAYCNGNPIMLVDLDGKRPSAAEAALMAECAYHEKKSYESSYEKLLQSGWVISEVSHASIKKNVQWFWTKWFEI